MLGNLRIDSITQPATGELPLLWFLLNFAQFLGISWQTQSHNQLQESYPYYNLMKRHWLGVLLVKLTTAGSLRLVTNPYFKSIVHFRNPTPAQMLKKATPINNPYTKFVHVNNSEACTSVNNSYANKTK